MTPASEDTQTLKLSMGENRSLRLSGPTTFLTVLVLVLMGFIGYLIDFNMKSWGDPINIKQSLQQHDIDQQEHATRMMIQHEDITLAIRWNTFVQWACSPSNSNQKAKQECSSIQLLKPDQEEPIRRRYRIMPNGDTQR